MCILGLNTAPGRALWHRVARSAHRVSKNGHRVSKNGHRENADAMAVFADTFAIFVDKMAVLLTRWPFCFSSKALALRTRFVRIWCAVCATPRPASGAVGIKRLELEPKC